MQFQVSITIHQTVDLYQPGFISNIFSKENDFYELQHDIQYDFSISTQICYHGNWFV